MKKIITIIFVVIVALVVALVLVKDIIATSLLENSLRSFTGLKFSSKGVNVDLLHSKLYLKGLAVFNPEGFPEEVMAVVPEVYINYDLPAFFTGKVHLNEMRLYLEKLAVGRNREGKLNIQVAQETAQKKVSQAKAHSAGPKTEKKQTATRPNMAFDVLVVKLGSITYKDYLSSGLALGGTVVLNTEERYENITSGEQLLDAILGQAAKGGASGFDIQGSFSGMKEDFKNIGDEFGKEFKGLGDSFKKIFSGEETK